MLNPLKKSTTTPEQTNKPFNYWGPRYEIRTDALTHTLPCVSHTHAHEYYKFPFKEIAQTTVFRLSCDGILGSVVEISGVVDYAQNGISKFWHEFQIGLSRLYRVYGLRGLFSHFNLRNFAPLKREKGRG